MFLKLKDIAVVSSGATFRSRIEVSASGNTQVIQMKDLNENNIVCLDEAIRVELAKLRLSHLLTTGDIIFRSRGQTHTAAIMKESGKSIILSAPLFRVRPNNKMVDPEFLLWWINQPSSQAYFASRSKGTSIKMISKECLEDLGINLPSLAQQKRIVQFFSLSMQEQFLLEEIKKRKQAYTQEVLMQMILKSTLTTSI